MSKHSKEEIGEIIQKIRDQHLSYSKGAKLYGIKVGILYEYNKKEAERNRESENTSAAEAEKEEKASKGSKLPSELEKLIVSYKEANKEHGYKRIEDWLKQTHLVVVTRKQIREVLKAHNMLGGEDSSFDKGEVREKGTRRFESKYPRALYQMDITYMYIKGCPTLYVVNIVDDYSRFCVGSEVCRDFHGDTMAGVLHTACERYGKPEKLLTDQGVSFYSWSMNKTLFQEYLDDMKIEHIVCDAHSPETQGKVERFNQTLKRELLSKRRFSGYEEAVRGISEFVMYYNYERCHQGIGGCRPADRFYGIAGEKRRIEAELVSKALDLSRGYMLCKFEDHMVSVVNSKGGIQVFLDGNLLEVAGEKDGCGSDKKSENV